MALSIESTAVRASSSSPLVSRFVQRSKKLRSGVIVSLNGRRSDNAAAGSLRLVVVRAGRDTVDVKEGDGLLPSGEWPENFSLLNYEDLSKHYEPGLFKPEVRVPCWFSISDCAYFFFLWCLRKCEQSLE